MKQYEVCASTGFHALDELLGGGLRRGELSCLADSVRTDSTELLCDIAAAFTEQTDESVLLVTVAGTALESEQKASAIRLLLAQTTGWDEKEIERRFFICCSAVYFTDQIRRCLHSDETIGLVLIDRMEWMYDDWLRLPYELKKTARLYAVPILAVQRVPKAAICSFYGLGISPEFDHVAFLRKTDGGFTFLPPQGNPLYMSGALMAAYHVWRRSDTLAEKHAAWQEIIETVPDEEIPFTRWKAPRESVHAFLRDYMALEDRLLREFYDADGQIAYNYYDPNFDLLVDNRGIYYDLNACLSAALSDLEDSDGYEVWLYRIDLTNGRRTRVLFDKRREPLDVKPEYELFVTEETILWDSFVALNRWFEDEPDALSPEGDRAVLNH